MVKELLLLSSLHKVIYNYNNNNIMANWIIYTGFDPSNLTQYSTSLVSSAAFIAQINVTDDSLRGEWRIMIQSQGSYSIQVLGSSELSFTEELYRIDSSNSLGFSRINGRPSKGKPLCS